MLRETRSHGPLSPVRRVVHVDASSRVGVLSDSLQSPSAGVLDLSPPILWKISGCSLELRELHRSTSFSRDGGYDVAMEVDHLPGESERMDFLQRCHVRREKARLRPPPRDLPDPPPPLVDVRLEFPGSLLPVLQRVDIHPHADDPDVGIYVVCKSTKELHEVVLSHHRATPRDVRNPRISPFDTPHGTSILDSVANSFSYHHRTLSLAGVIGGKETLKSFAILDRGLIALGVVGSNLIRIVSFRPADSRDSRLDRMDSDMWKDDPSGTLCDILKSKCVSKVKLVRKVWGPGSSGSFFGRLLSKVPWVGGAPQSGGGEKPAGEDAASGDRELGVRVGGEGTPEVVDVVGAHFASRVLLVVLYDSLDVRVFEMLKEPESCRLILAFSCLHDNVRGRAIRHPPTFPVEPLKVAIREKGSELAVVVCYEVEDHNYSGSSDVDVGVPRVYFAIASIVGPPVLQRGKVATIRRTPVYVYNGPDGGDKRVLRAIDYSLDDAGLVCVCRDETGLYDIERKRLVRGDRDTAWVPLPTVLSDLQDSVASHVNKLEQKLDSRAEWGASCWNLISRLGADVVSRTLAEFSSSTSRVDVEDEDDRMEEDGDGVAVPIPPQAQAEADDDNGDGDELDEKEELLLPDVEGLSEKVRCHLHRVTEEAMKASKKGFTGAVDKFFNTACIGNWALEHRPLAIFWFPRKMHFGGLYCVVSKSLVTCLRPVSRVEFVEAHRATRDFNTRCEEEYPELDERVRALLVVVSAVLKFFPPHVYDVVEKVAQTGRAPRDLSKMMMRPEGGLGNLPKDVQQATREEATFRLLASLCEVSPDDDGPQEQEGEEEGVPATSSQSHRDSLRFWKFLCCGAVREVSRARYKVVADVFVLLCVLRGAGRDFRSPVATTSLAKRWTLLLRKAYHSKWLADNPYRLMPSPFLPAMQVTECSDVAEAVFSRWMYSAESPVPIASNTVVNRAWSMIRLMTAYDETPGGDAIYRKHVFDLMQDRRQFQLIYDFAQVVTPSSSILSHFLGLFYAHTDRGPDRALEAFETAAEHLSDGTASRWFNDTMMPLTRFRYFDYVRKLCAHSPSLVVECATRALREPRTAEDMQSRAVLLSVKFAACLAGGQYDEALHCIRLNDQRHAKLDLEILVSTMCERGSNRELIEVLQFHYLDAQVREILFRRAHHGEVLPTVALSRSPCPSILWPQPDFYSCLYSFLVYRSQFSFAAMVMYDKASRLKRRYVEEIERQQTGDETLRHVEVALAVLSSRKTALSLSLSLLGMDAVTAVHDVKDKKKKKKGYFLYEALVVSREDLRKEFARTTGYFTLLSGRLRRKVARASDLRMLWKLDLPRNTASSSSSSDAMDVDVDVVPLVRPVMVKEGLPWKLFEQLYSTYEEYDTALTIAVHFGLPLAPLFQRLAHIVATDGKRRPYALELLGQYLRIHDRAPLFMLHQTVLSTILSEDKDTMPPRPLVDTLKKGNPSGLLRVLLSFDLLFEAFKVVMQHLDRLKGDDDDESRGIRGDRGIIADIGTLANKDPVRNAPMLPVGLSLTYVEQLCRAMKEEVQAQDRSQVDRERMARDLSTLTEAATELIGLQ